MMEEQRELQHFILTRFNLLLWNKDKEGCSVRTEEWLAHRFSLFERFCLPSVRNQTCKDFEWIVLFDSQTPEDYQQKIAAYQETCPQLTPIYVDSSRGHLFARIFRKEVVKRVNARRVITSYLDNDDALRKDYVEDLQRRALTVTDGTFINYTDGYQFYTDYRYLMQIHYPRNHFVSVVESGNTLTLKTIYGYGSHYYIVKIPHVKIENIEKCPMWCEVIHERNMGNDAYFLLKTRMINDKDKLHHDFSINHSIESGVFLYVFVFLPRYARTFLRRTKHYLFGRKW